MQRTKLAALEFLAGFRSGRRSYWLVPATLALGLSACSVYDPRLLPARGSGGITKEDGGGPQPDAQSGDSDAAVVECTGEEFARCVRPHAQANCAGTQCVIQKCLDGYVDCDGADANGCEAKLDTPENCGLCKAACHYNRASADCVSGHCQLAECNKGYGNCDGDNENGCETDLNSLTNCGDCGKTCSAATNATAGCIDGKCGVQTCIGPFGDCDGDPSNGCEQRLDNPEHCGKCDAGCDPAHGDGTCASGACVVTKCEPGFADCNGLAADGCETALDTVEHCGACGTSCKLAHVTHPSCEKSGDDYRCVVTHACDPETAPCTPDALENGCEAGYSDCDTDTANGCETDLSRLSNCGSCGTKCNAVFTINLCTDGKCADMGCAPGADKCGGSSCRQLATDPQNCGKCGQACSGNATLCAGGKCTPQMCQNGQADCDGDQANGCETSLTSNDNCGLCGQRCPNRPHAGGVCRTNGQCGIGNCDAGWKDCDGDPTNGCEVNIRTNNDCGECAKPCIAPNADTTCNNNGQCQISQCSEGRDDCNKQLDDGCEADLGLPTTCGGCNNVCASLMDVVSSSCENGKCNLVCGSGRADCDGSPANGCEADLSNAASCGKCGNNCTALANVASATCSSGACGNITCRPGFADCNGNPADGCETSLNSASDCGGCNKACAPAHGQGQCTNGTCNLMQCDTGYDDCNRQAADGCETALTSAPNCGGCGKTCANGGACTNGTCGCQTDAECGTGNSCCNGTCADTSSACFVWPCLPGTEAPAANANCGGCGAICLLWCCQDLAASAAQ